MRPVFEQLPGKLATSNIMFGEVNIAASPTLAPAYGIRSVPSVALFRQQTLVTVIAGEMPLDALAQRVIRALDSDLSSSPAQPFRASDKTA